MPLSKILNDKIKKATQDSDDVVKKRSWANRHPVIMTICGFIVFISIVGSLNDKATPSSENTEINSEPVISDEQCLNDLKEEIASIKNLDTKIFYNDIPNLQISAGLFNGEAKKIEEARTRNNKDINALANTLEREIRAIQVREFPKIRKRYAELVNEKMWENDIGVVAIGGANSTLEFTGGIFASNKNIKSSQEIISDMVKLLRFDRVNYRWYKNAEEYSYYEVKSLKDSDVASLIS
jgi:hypothetical protein